MNRSQVNHDIRFLQNRLNELQDSLNDPVEGIYSCSKQGKIKEIKALKRLLKYIKGYALLELNEQKILLRDTGISGNWNVS